MEQYINAAALTPRTLLMLFIAVGAAYFFFKATKHLVVGLLFTVAAIGGVAWLTGVIDPNDLKNAAEAAKSKAGEQFDAANEKAKKIGEMGHSTSAGSASETNEHFKSNLERKK